MSLLPTLVALPLACAVIVFVLPSRLRAFASLALCVPHAAASLAIVWRIAHSGPLTHALGGWRGPLGIGLVADPLAAVMTLVTAVVSLACMVHAARSLRGAPAAEGFWPLVWFMIAALDGIWLSADLFNLYVGLELLGLAAVGLVALTGTAEALAAAMRYLLAALVGSLAYLLGTALVYAAIGSLSLEDLATHAQARPTLLIAAAFLTAGLLVKSALFPLHGWLPPAHGGAVAPVSALLSALVIKASLYVLIRIWLALGPGVAWSGIGTVLGTLGAGAVIWGGWMALHQTHLKRLVAYSTASQIGYLFLFFPLTFGTPVKAALLAWDGTWLLVVSHALAKAGMFLAAGNLMQATGHVPIAELAGISRYRPIALLTFGIAGVSLMGLPPSGGFLAKWLLIQSAVESEQWVWVATLLGGGVITAGYVFKVLSHVFGAGRDDATFEAPPLAQELPALVLAGASIAVGLAAHTPLEWVRMGSAIAGGR